MVPSPGIWLTASATSLTSPQVPIHALWNDGRENLLGALLMAGQYIIPEVSGLATGAAWVGGGTMNATELMVMAHVGTHRPEVGTVLKTCVPHLELTEPRKGSCPPPTFLSPARLYVVDILHLYYIHIHESMEMDCAHLRLWSLLCLSSWAPSHLAEEEEKQVGLLQARSHFVCSSPGDWWC